MKENSEPKIFRTNIFVWRLDRTTDWRPTDGNDGLYRDVVV